MGWKYFVVSIMLLFSFCLQAQEIQTEVEPSRLLHIQFYDMGNIDAIEFKAKVTTDVLSNKVKKSVYLEMIFQNELLMQPKINEFDASEIENLQKSCDYILESINTQLADHYSDIVYVCKGGFTVGAFYTPVKQKWTIYLKLQYSDPKSTLHIDSDELLYFKKLLGDIKRKLEEIPVKGS